MFLRPGGELGTIVQAGCTMHTLTAEPKSTVIWQKTPKTREEWSKRVKSRPKAVQNSPNNNRWAIGV